MNFEEVLNKINEYHQQFLNETYLKVKRHLALIVLELVKELYQLTKDSEDFNIYE